MRDIYKYLTRDIFYFSFDKKHFFHKCEEFKSGGSYIIDGKCRHCGYKAPVSKKKLEVMRALKELIS